MKHALVILCHQDISQLEKLVEFFDDDFTFYVHVDKKSDILKEEVDAFVQSHPNVHVYRKYKVNWGGIDILRVVLYLMRLVLKHEKIDYIHTCSAQDYPIKKLQELKDFYKNLNGKQFIEYHQLPYSRWNQGTFERLEGYQLYDLLDFSTEKGRSIIRRVNDWQKRLGIRRGIPGFYPRLYGGSIWMSITRECAFHVIHGDHTAKRLLRRLRYTFGSDEIFFQTVIMNSPFRETVINDNKRLIFWREGAMNPEVLTRKLWWNIATSDCLWARKFRIPDSNEVYGLLDRYVFSEDNIEIGSNGAWCHDSFKGHVYDNGIAQGILWLVRTAGIRTAIDFGCGPGWYTRLLLYNGVEIQGYDGNPNVETMSSYFFSNGFYCQYVDLEDELEAEEPVELVMSLEVGEHIPKAKEQVFLDNLARNSSRYILLSWAVPGQNGEGHVNWRPNDYIISNMSRRGFNYSAVVSNHLRSLALNSRFRNSVMFFEKSKSDVTSLLKIAENEQ